MSYYAFTLKKTRGTPVVSDYETYLAAMLQKNPGIDDRGRFYEYTRGCHVHMLLYSERPIGYSDLKLTERQHGWNINVSPCRSLGAWNTYIRKDQNRADIRVAKLDVRKAARRDFSVSSDSKSDTDLAGAIRIGSGSDELLTPPQLFQKYGRIV